MFYSMFAKEYIYILQNNIAKKKVVLKNSLPASAAYPTKV